MDCMELGNRESGREIALDIANEAKKVLVVNKLPKQYKTNRNASRMVLC